MQKATECGLAPLDADVCDALYKPSAILQKAGAHKLFVGRADESDAGSLGLEDESSDEYVERDRSWRPRSTATVEHCVPVQSEIRKPIDPDRLEGRGRGGESVPQNDILDARGDVGESSNAGLQKTVVGHATGSPGKRDAGEINRRGLSTGAHCFAQTNGKRRRLDGTGNGNGGHINALGMSIHDCVRETSRHA